MRTILWALLGLLVMSNLAWWATWRADNDATSEQEQRQKRLEREVALLKDLLAKAETDPDVSPAAPAPAEAAALQGRGDAATVLAAERRLEEERRAKVRREALAASRRAQAETLDPIRRQIQQIRNPALREEGFQALVAILAGDDPHLIRGALQALIDARDTKLDGARFRPLILDQLGSTDAGVRRTALYALYNVAREDGDLQFALRAIEDPSDQVRGSASHLIRMHTGGAIEGNAAEGILRLLDQDDPRARKEAMRGIWGATVTPAIQTRLLEIAQNPAERSDAVYFGLSTLNNKSPEVLSYLVDALADRNHNVSHRARWGLNRGVPEEHGVYLADALADAVDLLPDRATQLEVVRLIERHGSADQVGRLRVLAENELTSEQVRLAAEHAIEQLGGR